MLLKPKPGRQPKKGGFEWQDHWTTFSTSVKDELAESADFLAGVTGFNRSTILRELLEWWVDKTIGLKTPLDDLKREWNELNWKEQREKRKVLRDSLLNLKTIELVPEDHETVADDERASDGRIPRE